MPALRPRVWLVGLIALALLGCAGPARAQTPLLDLLELVPPDFGVCLTLHDLRGQANQLARSEWQQAVRRSPLGQALLESTEWKRFTRFEGDLQAGFGIDWPTLRDDVLGTAVVLAHRPGTPGQAEEEGLLLLKAFRPELLAKLVQRLNQLQIERGEVKKVEAVAYKEATYQRRDEGRKTSYYFVQGPLLAVSTQETQIRAVIDRGTLDPSLRATWPERYRKAGAERAFLSLCINPQVIRPELFQNRKEHAAAAHFWQALDAIFLTLHVGNELDVRLTLQARPADLPAALQSSFLKTPTPSTLWRRFPEPAMLTIAGTTPFAELTAALVELLPPPERNALHEKLQRTLGAVTGLDVFKDIVPNLGPDWGLCVLPAAAGQTFPPALFALAVQPGHAEQPVDVALVKALHLFASLAVLDHNRKQTPPTRIKTAHAGPNEIKYLSNDALFPPGYQPAYGLRDGLLVLATAPEPIAQLRPASAKAPASDAAPLAQLSTRMLAQHLDARHDGIVTSLTHHQAVPESVARRSLAHAIAFLQLFDHLHLSQQGIQGQLRWSLRIVPAGKTE